MCDIPFCVWVYLFYNLPKKRKEEYENKTISLKYKLDNNNLHIGLLTKL